jgi:uncharacterized protein RhaS with RHS repeats
LYYHGARYYAAWLGRWTSADPMGLADGIEWGHGDKLEGTQSLMNMITRNAGERRAYVERLRSRGVTPEMARAWAAAYEYEISRIPSNTTAAARVTLLRRIADLL